MENIQTKVPNNRRGRLFLVVLLAIILVLSFHIYREHNFKKDLVRRKAFLISMLRETKASMGKMNLQIAGQKKELAANQRETQELQSNLDETIRSYQLQAQRLKGLQESATEHKNSLDALKKQYNDASSVIKIVKDKLESTIESCQDTNNTNEKLNKDIKAKEDALQECLQEKETLSKENQDMKNNQQTQSTARLHSNNANTVRETTNNQHPAASSASDVNVGLRQSRFKPNPGSQTDNGNSDSATTHDSNPKQVQMPLVKNQIATNTQRNEITEPDGTASQSSNSNLDSTTTRDSNSEEAQMPVKNQITTNTQGNKITEPGAASQSSNSNLDSATTRDSNPEEADTS